MTTYQQQRQSAIEWWDKLSFENQWFMIVKYKEDVTGYPDRDPNSLTGREIQILFDKEV